MSEKNLVGQLVSDAAKSISTPAAAVRTICETAAQFAPPGLKGVAEGVCKVATGTETRVVYDSPYITCTKTMNTLGKENISCTKK